MATAPSQMNTRSQAGVASTWTADTSTQSAPKFAHRKSTKLLALQCVCGKVFENKQYLDLHIGQKHNKTSLAQEELRNTGKGI